MSSAIDTKQADPSGPQAATRYLLIGSGRDGVGKSSICTNLAIALARSGRKVAILDTDSGITNTHHLLGVSPSYTLAQVINGDCVLRDAVNTGPGGIVMVQDGDHARAFIQQDEQGQHSFLQQLRNWEQGLDYLLIDTSATDQSALAHWFDVADELVLVLVPQPGTLSETFSLLSHQNPSRRSKPKHIVVNRASGASQAEMVFDKFSANVRKYLDSHLLYCGYIRADDNIRNGFALQHPVAMYRDEDPSCAHFLKLAQALETQLAPRADGRPALSEALACRRPTEATTKRTRAPARSHPGASSTPPKDKALFMQMPAMADELIHAGELGGEELKRVVDQLISTGRHEFRQQFSAVLPTADPAPAGETNPGSQQSLLSALQQNRRTGKPLDQLLNEFLGEQH